MTKTANVWLRYPAICGLWLLLAVLIPLTWVMRKATGGGLWIAEWADDRLHELTGGV